MPQVDVTDPASIDSHMPSFEALDVLILCQDAVRYGKEELARPLPITLRSAIQLMLRPRPGVSLCRTLGKAWARDGVRFNGVAPGYVATKLTSFTSDKEKRAAASYSAFHSSAQVSPPK